MKAATNSNQRQQLARLVAASYDWDTAKAFSKFVLEDENEAVIATTAREVLSVLPTMPGACAIMSAVFAARLESKLQAPIHVVAGTLTVGGTPIFGKFQQFDSDSFSESNYDWDGHVWAMIGGYIADISVFRTAYSHNSPPKLAECVLRKFGSGKGFYFDRWDRTARSGLEYHPSYVLKYDEVTSLLKGADHIVHQSGGAQLAT